MRGEQNRTEQKRREEKRREKIRVEKRGECKRHHALDSVLNKSNPNNNDDR
jgi:hypothetical protein